ncbi:MAG: response regulator [Ignavibacteriales bacterium]|nr:MAG: response regulator [Ignavibacteriaceae bacterium]MBW7874256.1 response regulator [Ignavibacteria bacterium]MCZ2143243.1 response regulator [Ignavibacteriales bacterium]OQY78658.1 MAG: DNA-binding response regulator [Ignavibacteriales bacterium UTCHB3]MBV6444123.1 Sensory transduction protein LytR [Ignavibacteriaceae bacterium]
MKAIIVDDERLARNELKRLLSEYPDIEVVDEAANVDEGVEKIKHHEPDVVFLDIQMPGKSGFDLLEELDRSPRVIFTTAYDEYAIKAFEFNALDYLLKPIEPARLSEAIKKVKIENPEDEELDIRKISKQLRSDDQVFVKDGDRCWFVKLEEVRLFESEGNYVRLFFRENKPLILKTLNYLDERLDSKTFFRANRKHIINLKYIENIEPWLNGGLLVKMKDGKKIEVSRRQSIKFKEMLSL